MMKRSGSEQQVQDLQRLQDGRLLDATAPMELALQRTIAPLLEAIRQELAGLRADIAALEGQRRQEGQ